MSLPVPNLDDRKFQDIVDELKRRIPDRMPEWTNHNVSDPGVALIELFAWMTEMTLFRLNQFPDRAMATLLNTVGFQAFPARPATVDVTFFVSPPKDDFVIGAGTKLGTVGGTDGPIDFETDCDVTVRKPGEHVTEVANPSGNFEPHQSGEIVCFKGLETVREQKWNPYFEQLDPKQQEHWRPRERFAGDATRFGFDASLGGLRLRIDIGADNDGLGIRPDQPPLVWEAEVDQRWVPCRVRADTTRGLNLTGHVEIEVPHGHSSGDGDKFWIQMRVDVGACPMYLKSPRLTSVEFGTVGVVVPAHHAERCDRETIGTSDGRPGQTFSLSRRPVLPRDPEHEHLVIDGVPWTEVADFRNAGRFDRCYTLDSAAGEIAFGPEVRIADGTKVQYGAIPEKDKTIEMTSYRVGGGARGNVQERSITSLRSAVSNVTRVENLEPARGGVDAETPEEAIARAPLAVRAGGRAVTAADYERMVLDVDPTLHRVVSRPPASPGDPLRLLIVPQVDEPVRAQDIDSYALDPDLCARIEEHLEARSLVGARVQIRTPYYQGVQVAIRVSAGSADEVATTGERLTMLKNDLIGDGLTVAEIVRERVKEALYEFINPITGGEDGSGLDFGQPLTAERIEAVVRNVPGVRDVHREKVVIFPVNMRQPEHRSGPTRRIEPQPDTLFMSYRHQVVIDDEPRRS